MRRLVRAGVVLAGAVLAASALWLLTRGADTPAARDERPAEEAAPNLPATGVPRTGSTPEQTSPPPRIGSRAEMAAFLTARGLNAERILNEYQAWREARGFFDAGPLANPLGTESPAGAYARLDASELREKLESDELPAIQEDAVRTEAVDSQGALAKYMGAAQKGSTAAMFGVSRTLDRIADLQREDASSDPELAARLRDWRNMDGSTDIRQEALAWSLAALRIDGPAVLDRKRLAQVEAMAKQLTADQQRLACAESSRFFGGYRANNGGSEYPRGVPPPVFVAEPDLKERLPCRDTDNPVNPPRSHERCQSFPARDATDRLIEIWICPEN
ncbi:MAG: hypothetical protein ABI661_07425 [Gammaproteobacteria bacterium]